MSLCLLCVLVGPFSASSPVVATVATLWERSHRLHGAEEGLEEEALNAEARTGVGAEWGPSFYTPAPGLLPAPFSLLPTEQAGPSSPAQTGEAAVKTLGSLNSPKAS